MLLDWLADYTEARVQGTDTYCVSELCQVPGLQVRIRFDTGHWGVCRAGREENRGGQGRGTGPGLDTH